MEEHVFKVSLITEDAAESKFVAKTFVFNEKYVLVSLIWVKVLMEQFSEFTSFRHDKKRSSLPGEC